MIRNLIIIGGGPAGNAAALAARAAGAGTVTLVERDAMGGTCTNRGCIPTKLLLARSEQLAATAGGRAPSGEWARLQTYRRGLVRGLARSIEERCRGAGVEVVSGEAVLLGGGGVRVRGAGGTVAELEGERILVAAGSAPASLPSAPVDGRTVITSDHALELTEIPASMVIVGSGAVGSEFATIFSRFGTRVTLVEGAERLFPTEDHEVGESFARHWEEAGVAVRVGDPVTAVEARGDRAVALLGSGAAVEASVVLLAAGRRPLGADLGCAGAGVDLGARGEILVDARYRSSLDGVYAAGDVTGRMLLAHVAEAEGVAAARYAVGADGGSVPYPSVSWSSFTSPEVASVGLGEEAARRFGATVACGRADFMDNVKARIDRAAAGFVKLVAESHGGRILGATIVGDHAAEMIHTIAMAVHNRMTVSDLQRFVFLHPSLSETIAEACGNIK